MVHYVGNTTSLVSAPDTPITPVPSIKSISPLSPLIKPISKHISPPPPHTSYRIPLVESVTDLRVPFTVAFYLFLLILIPGYLIYTGDPIHNTVRAEADRQQQAQQAQQDKDTHSSPSSSGIIAYAKKGKFYSPGITYARERRRFEQAKGGGTKGTKGKGFWAGSIPHYRGTRQASRLLAMALMIVPYVREGREEERREISMLLCVVCGVWCVVCGVWCAECGAWCVVRAMWWYITC